MSSKSLDVNRQQPFYPFQFDLDYNSDIQDSPLNTADSTSTKPSDMIISISGILLDISKKTGAKLTNTLIKLFHHEDFSFDEFLTHVKNVSDCKKVTVQSCHQFLDKNGFVPTSITTNLPDSSSVTSVLHITDPVKVIEKQLKVLFDVNALQLRPTSTSQSDHPPQLAKCPVNRHYFTNLYHLMRSHIISSGDSTTIWNDHDGTLPRSFVPFIQLFTDKTASSLSTSAYTAYPIHAVVMNTSPERREWLINNGLTILGFLPAHASQTTDSGMDHVDNEDNPPSEGIDKPLIELEDYVDQTSSTNGRDSNMRILHHALRTFLSPLESLANHGKTILFNPTSIWSWFPLLVSYCCDIPESKNLFAVKHGTASDMPCVRCESPQLDFSRTSTANPRSRYRTDMARSTVSRLSSELTSLQSTKSGNLRNVKRTEINDCLAELSLSNWPSFLESSTLLPDTVIPDFYDIYTFEPLHNFFLGISPKIKLCLLHYLGSSTRQATVNNKRRTYYSLRTPILRGLNTLLRFFQANSTLPGIRVDFSKNECTSQLNGIYTSTGLRGMLEGKDYKNLDSLFPFLYGYVDRWLGNAEDCHLTKLHTEYTDLQQSVMTDNHGYGWTDKDIQNLRSSISDFKKHMVSSFQDSFPTDLGTLKFHLLDHLPDDLSRFGSTKVLSASPFEHFNLLVKRAYASTSKRLLTRDTETADILHFNLQRRTLHDTPSTLKTLDTDNMSVSSRIGLVQHAETLPILYFHRFNQTVNLPKNKFYETIQRSLHTEVLDQFGSMLADEIHASPTSPIPSSVSVQIVQSGDIIGGFLPTLTDCTTVDGTSVLKLSRQYEHQRQRIYGISWDRPSLRRKQSFIVIKGFEDEHKDVLWVAKVIFLFRFSHKRPPEKKDLAFVQFMEVTPPLDGVDDALGCVCLRWARDDCIDHTLDPSLYLAQDNVETAEWYGIVPVNSIVGTAQVIRSNIPIKPFSEQIPWPFHRFYINRFNKYEI